MKEAPRVFNVSTFPGVSKPQWSLLFQTPVPGRNHTCILFIFHEGQARLQLLVPPLPALGCAVFGLLEEEAASWPGQLGTFQASETLVLGPRDIQTGLVTCVAAPSTWLCTGLTSRNGNTQEKTQIPPSRATRFDMDTDCSFPEWEIYRKTTRSKCRFSGHLFLAPVLSGECLKTS